MTARIAGCRGPGRPDICHGATSMYAANLPAEHAQHKEVVHANVSQMCAHSIVWMSERQTCMRSSCDS